MMKKIISFLALTGFVFAAAAIPAMGITTYDNNIANDTAVITPTPTAKVKKPVLTPSPEKLACVSTAVEKRDNAIITAWDAFSASARNALLARRDALKAAWLLTDKTARRAAIKKAWTDFRAAAKTARVTLNKARRAAWKQYAVDLKACRAQGAPTSDDYGTEGLEANL